MHDVKKKNYMAMFRGVLRPPNRAKGVGGGEGINSIPPPLCVRH